MLNIRKNMSLLANTLVVISIIAPFARNLLPKGFVIYENKMVSILPLLSFHSYFVLGMIISGSILILYLGWITFNFFSSRKVYDYLSITAVLYLFFLPLVWFCTLYMLSEPLSVLKLFTAFLLYIPMSIIVTWLSLGLVKTFFI